MATLDRLNAPTTHDVARAYARAGAEVPPELVQCLIGHMDRFMQSGHLPVDPNSEIERLSAVLDFDEHYLHRKLEKWIGGLPEELRAAFAYEVACQEEAVCGRTAMYWLLDATADVQLAATEGFRERAQTLEDPMRRVPLLARDIRIGVRPQGRVDDAGEPVQLGTPHRLPPPIPRRRRIAQHLLHRAAVDPEPPPGLVMAQTLLDNRQPNRRIELHAVHPPPRAKTDKGP